MKKNLILSFSGLTLLLAGYAYASTASVPYNGPELQIKTPEYPPIGTIKVAHPGESLVEKGKISLEKMLIVHQDIKISDYTVTANAYKQFGYDKTYNFFLPYGVHKKKTADSVEALAVAKTPKAKVCLITRQGKKSCAAGDYTKKDVGSDRGENIIRTLSYNGSVDGHKISLRYREYAGSIAKPVAAKTISFDLAKSSVIHFNGVEIEVIKADDKQLKYKLLHNFQDEE